MSRYNGRELFSRNPFYIFNKLPLTGILTEKSFVGKISLEKKYKNLLPVFIFVNV